MNDQNDRHDDEIRVKTTFSLGKKPTFHHSYLGENTVGTVLADSRTHFDAKEEPNVVWYLSAHELRQVDSKTLEQVGDTRDEISFRLVKEITQG